jgi:hypothetical protein
MHSVAYPAHRTLLRTLAFLALLAMLGVQALEVQHFHGADNPAPECFVCQASAGTAALAQAAQVPFEPATATLSPAVQAGSPAAPFHRYTARGPPAPS